MGRETGIKVFDDSSILEERAMNKKILVGPKIEPRYVVRRDWDGKVVIYDGDRPMSVEAIVQTLEETLDALAAARAETAKLIERWPDDRDGSGPMLHQAAKDEWWLEYIRGDRWHEIEGISYPTRRAAVRAAAGLEPEGEGP